MYGLKKSAILAYNNLKKKLQPHGYSLVVGTVDLWKHKTKRTTFCLCFDDFGIKSYNKADADHLLQAIDSNYSL